MNAVHMMSSQAGVAVGGILWGGAAISLGLEKTLIGGAVLLAASLVLAIPLSINFAQSLNLDPAPLEASHDFPLVPQPDDGPVTVTVEIMIRPEDREEFLKSTNQLRLMFLRNGATLYRVDENLENPGTFRSEMVVRSWAEHVRQHARTTKEETALADRLWAMHVGTEPPVVRHYLQANRLSTPMEFGHFRKPQDEGAANYRMTGLGRYEVRLEGRGGGEVRLEGRGGGEGREGSEE
jgi:hypothetical protein